MRSCTEAGALVPKRTPNRRGNRTRLIGLNRNNLGVSSHPRALRKRGTKMRLENAVGKKVHREMKKIGSERADIKGNYGSDESWA